MRGAKTPPLSPSLILKEGGHDLNGVKESVCFFLYHFQMNMIILSEQIIPSTKQEKVLTQNQQQKRKISRTTYPWSLCTITRSSKSKKHSNRSTTLVYTSLKFTVLTKQVTISKEEKK